MDIIRRTILPFAQGLPLKAMIGLSRQKVIFPMYHAVSDTCPAHLKHLYRIRNIKQFTEDLDTLCRYFEPLSPETLKNPEEYKKRKKPGFILSFDDGLREIIEVVAPILEDRGIRAVFFLNNAFIDNKALFFRYRASLLCDILMSSQLSDQEKKKINEILGLSGFDIKKSVSAILELRYRDQEKFSALSSVLNFDESMYLSEHRPYLTSEEIALLLKKGHMMGAHTFDHPLLAELSEDQMKDEISRSVADMDKKFSPGIRLFAFPFTDDGVPARVIDDISREKTDYVFGSAGLKNEINGRHIQRIPIEISAASACSILKTEYLYYLLKAPFGKNTRKR
jgi:peptidoglycan/xylan/chitin deacetylase (PgdA/CDA1 family)